MAKKKHGNATRMGLKQAEINKKNLKNPQVAPMIDLGGDKVDIGFNANTMEQPMIGRHLKGVPKQPSVQDIIEEIEDNFQYIELLANATPYGMMVPYSLPTEPVDWVFCNGQVCPESPLRDLLIEQGNPFGESGGLPTVPNLSGRTIVGNTGMGNVQQPALDQTATELNKTLGTSSGLFTIPADQAPQREFNIGTEDNGGLLTITTDKIATGITINNAKTGIDINNAKTGISIDSGKTNIAINNAFTGLTSTNGNKANIKNSQNESDRTNTAKASITMDNALTDNSAKKTGDSKANISSTDGGGANTTKASGANISLETGYAAFLNGVTGNGGSHSHGLVRTGNTDMGNTLNHGGNTEHQPKNSAYPYDSDSNPGDDPKKEPTPHNGDGQGYNLFQNSPGYWHNTDWNVEQALTAGKLGVRSMSFIRAGGGGITTGTEPVHSHSVADTGHGHTLNDNSHRHTIEQTDHSHTIPNLPHKHTINDDGHRHVIAQTNHSHGITDKQHKHTVDDNGHVHNITDNGHVHNITDNGHVHDITDPTHNHVVHATGTIPGSDFEFDLTQPGLVVNFIIFHGQHLPEDTEPVVRHNEFDPVVEEVEQLKELVKGLEAQINV